MADSLGVALRRVLAWLPLTFLAWYLLAGPIASLVATFLQPVLRALSDGLIFRLESEGALIHAMIRLGGGQYGSLTVPPGRLAELILEGRPMIHGYGIPLFFALLLGLPRVPGKRLATLAAVSGLLALVAFGVAMGIGKSLLFDLDPAVSARLGLHQMQIDLIALGYQFGALILPAVVPLALWAGLHGQALLAMTRTGAAVDGIVRVS
ncbi:exosortase H-associated membrane protein [Pseudomonas sp. RIT-PI-AD]|uniref:exosortase H-associated membrane protein n=1 Tax=Pseudomonas sp. RIT-PI-AD TaxID=3035294 RepID=UPI0021DACEFC|nr:exosortase H-associated membrane protein [Pseudomonas sp. RIT-PI-AD]